MPKDKKALPKKQAKRGNLPLPVDVIDELRDWKLAYELAWSDPDPAGEQYTMTYEQLIRRLLEGVKRLDPEVWAVHEAREKSRVEQDEMMTEFKKKYWPELMWTRQKVNKFYDEMIGEIMDDSEGKDSPTSVQEKAKEDEVLPVPETTATVDPTEGKVWNMKYFFEKDGEEIEAYTGYWPGFYAEVNGEERDQDAMMADGWVLMNDAGIEISPTQAMDISIRIKSLLDSSVGAIEDESFFPEEEVKEEEVMPVPEAAAADPTEGAVWDMRYYFVKDGEELDALVGDMAAFYCTLNGRNTGMATMMNSGWKLVNEAGVELTKSQAMKIRDTIKAHNAEKR